MKKLTNRFEATNEQGHTIRIYEYTNYVNTGTFEDPKAKIEGMKEFRTRNGNGVNRIGKGKYKVFVPVVGEMIYTSDSPNAS